MILTYVTFKMPTLKTPQYFWIFLIILLSLFRPMRRRWQIPWSLSFKPRKQRIVSIIAIQQSLVCRIEFFPQDCRIFSFLKFNKTKFHFWNLIQCLSIERISDISNIRIILIFDFQFALQFTIQHKNPFSLKPVLGDFSCIFVFFLRRVFSPKNLIYQHLYINILYMSAVLFHLLTRHYIHNENSKVTNFSGDF